MKTKDLPGRGSVHSFRGEIRWVEKTACILLVLAAAALTGCEDPATSVNEEQPAAQIENPCFDITTGTYTRDLLVELSCATEGAGIYYTTDGTSPTQASTEFVEPIIIAGHGMETTVKAIASKEGLRDSGIVQAAYVISYDKTAAPVFDPPAGYYTSARSVAITTETPDASIRYTFGDGTQEAPTETTGTLYAGPVAVGASGTIKALVYKTEMLPSDVETAANTIFVPSSDHDIAVAAITNPTDSSTISAGTVTITAAISNYGSYAESLFNVHLDVHDSGDTLVFPDTQAIAALVSGESTAISFTAWNAAEGTYRITVTVDLPGDEVPANDSLEITVTVGS